VGEVAEAACDDLEVDFERLLARASFPPWLDSHIAPKRTVGNTSHCTSVVDDQSRGCGRSDNVLS
jgi:hypothetical protein